jgi:hypothetical protein
MKVSSNTELVDDFVNDYHYHRAEIIKNAVVIARSMEDLQALQQSVSEHEDDIVIDITGKYILDQGRRSRALSAKVDIMHDVGRVFCIKTIIVKF